MFCLVGDDFVRVFKKEWKWRIYCVWEYYLWYNILYGFYYVFDIKLIWCKLIWVVVLLIVGGMFFNEVKESIK